MNPPKIYHAHPVTGEYLGQGFADPDPLDPDNWLVPAHAFLDEPPQLEQGRVACRTDGQVSWVSVEDNRGTVYSTVTGQADLYEEIGPLPATLTRTARPSAYHCWNGSAWELDAAARDVGVRQQVLIDRDARLGLAGLRIGPLQDAVELDRATEREQALLMAWKDYRVELGRIEQQEGFPLDVRWPQSPDEDQAALPIT